MSDSSPDVVIVGGGIAGRVALEPFAPERFVRA